MITCPHCGATNSSGTVYCAECRTNVHWHPDPDVARALFKRRESWWRFAVASPPVFTGLGFLAAMLFPPSSSDWLGLRFIGFIMLGLIAGALGCIACTIISYRKEEGMRGLAALVSLPCLGYLLWVLYVMAMSLMEIVRG